MSFHSPIWLLTIDFESAYPILGMAKNLAPFLHHLCPKITSIEGLNFLKILCGDSRPMAWGTPSTLQVRVLGFKYPISTMLS